MGTYARHDVFGHRMKFSTRFVLFQRELVKTAHIRDVRRCPAVRSFLTGQSTWQSRRPRANCRLTGDCDVHLGKKVRKDRWAWNFVILKQRPGAMRQSLLWKPPVPALFRTLAPYRIAAASRAWRRPAHGRHLHSLSVRTQLAERLTDRLASRTRTLLQCRQWTPRWPAAHQRWPPDRSTCAVYGMRCGSAAQSRYQGILRLTTRARQKDHRLRCRHAQAPHAAECNDADATDWSPPRP